MIKKDFSNFIDKLQKDIVTSLEKIDGKEKFKCDNWTRKKAEEGSPWLLKMEMFLKKAG